MAPPKRDGPMTCITFLGIQVDTVAGELRIPYHVEDLVSYTINCFVYLCCLMRLCKESS